MKTIFEVLGFSLLVRHLHTEFALMLTSLDNVDSGGPGCYSQLIVLKEIMSRVAYDEDKEPEELNPGYNFDFIGGSGFGAYVLRSEKRFICLILEL
jgi:hypothetical protein